MHRSNVNRRRAALAIVCLLSVPAAAAQIELAVGDAAAAPQQTATVDVTVRSLKDAVDFQMVLEYDPEVVEPAGVELGPDVGSAMVESNDETPGRLGISMAASQPMAMDDGVLLQVKLKAVGDAGATCELVPTDVEAHQRADMAQILVAKAESGTFTVGGSLPWMWVLIAAGAVILLLIIAAVLRKGKDKAAD